MDRTLREKILAANVSLHRNEAELYDRIHPELTNREERLRLERLVGSAAKSLPGEAEPTALDIGAGTGFLTGKLIDWGLRVTAQDISAAMLERLKEKHAAAVAAGRIKLALGDIDTFLTLTDKRYALIAASSVLHHLPDYAETIRRLTERLVPGGSLLLFHEPMGRASGVFERLLRRLDWKLAWLYVISWDDLMALRQTDLDYEMADYHESHGFDEGRVRATLKAAGLTVVAAERYATAQTALVRWIFRWFYPPRTWSLVARKNR